jgi:hypothetical protein
MPFVSESDVVLVRTEDWEALYFKGENISENHKVSIDDLIEALGGEVIELTTEQDALLQKNGYLPNSFHVFEEKYLKGK